MNKHKIEYYDKSEYNPLRVSDEINAHVVTDLRVKDKKLPGPFVAYPVAKVKPYKWVSRSIRSLSWLQGLHSWMRVAS